MSRRTWWAAGLVMGGLAVAACGSTKPSSSSSATTVAPSPTTTTGSPASTPLQTTPGGSGTGGAATCPTSAQASSALGVSATGPNQTSAGGTGIVCRYTESAGIAIVAIFAHQSDVVFAGQVSNAPGNPAMPAISGVGDGAYGSTIAGRSIVNAYSNAHHTTVAAQATGAIAPVEALARVALSDN